MRIEIHRPFGFLTLVYMGAVAGLLLRPDLSTEHADPLMAFISNLAHLPAFAGLAYLLLKTLRGRRGQHDQPPEAIGLALLVATAFAATTEWAQLFVPGRDPSASDFVLDLAGILGSVVVLRLAQRRRRRPAACSAPAQGNL